MKIPTFSLSRLLQGDGWELAVEILRTRLWKAGQESKAPWADAAVLDGKAALATDLEPGAPEEWPGARTWSGRGLAVKPR